MRVSMYRDVWDRHGAVVHAETVVRAIIEGRWKDQIKAVRKSSGSEKDELKKRLPAVTFSGVFEKRRGGISALHDYTHILVADVDHKVSGFTADLASRDPHCLFQFRSPSRGLKMGFLISSGPEHHKEAGFLRVKSHVQERYKLEIDEQCKDINRLCFISWDPMGSWNAEATPLYVLEPPKEEKKTGGFREVGIRGGRNAIDAATNFANRFVGAYMEGRRNAWLFAFASSCNKRGVPQGECLASTSHLDLSAKEIETTINSAYQNREEHGTLRSSSVSDRIEKMLGRFVGND